MNSQEAQRLFHMFSPALAFLEIEKTNGDIGIGSAFHIGDGIFITARHVIEHHKILQLRSTEPVGISHAAFYAQLGVDQERAARDEQVLRERLGGELLYKHWPEPLQLSSEPIYDEDPSSDLAILRTDNVHPKVPSVPLGWHFDDFVYRGVWHLSEALVLGYPPIPLTSVPHIVAARAEINAVVNLRGSSALHFVLSGTPRGGFSGGLALHEDGFALGLVTSSLLDGDKPAESGFFAVLSIERIRVSLEANKLLPASQATPPWEGQ